MDSKYSFITDKMFNTTGPCNMKEHYMLPPLDRLPEVQGLIRRRKYFLIHAARQSGKTTALQFLVSDIHKDGQLTALYCSLETLQEWTDYEQSMTSIAALILEEGMNSGLLSLTKEEFQQWKESGDVASRVVRALRMLSEVSQKPLVVFFDEVDTLPETVLISFLRQLRAGYINRERNPFPSSIALVGMRRIQDYKVQVREEDTTLGTASPFNITAQSLTLRNFTQDEVRALYEQHTVATGQSFEEGVYPLVMEYTGGQPWLVNAIAAECVENLHRSQYIAPITADDVITAKETIIRRRDPHMLSLLKRLDEERVLRVVEAVVSGNEIPLEPDDPALEYVLDLGILKQENGSLIPSNRMYAEMIARYLTWSMQSKFLRDIRELPWISGNQLDMNWLVKDFQAFWRKDASAWQEIGRFREAAPHVLFMAFLQRVVNGGGHITHEMALGSYRLDIGLEYNGYTYAIELKMKDHFDEEKALSQLDIYLEKLNVSEGWLLVFDPKPIPKRVGVKRFTWKDVMHNEKCVHIVGF